ncbi:hypothetical protein Ancab_029251 [Ancistrocladus abbreviatus]
MDGHLPLERHHSYPHPPPTPPGQPPPPQPHSKLTPGETIFRILCPATKTGALIGKGGSVIRQLREETGAKIRILDDFHHPHCDDRVILIVASNTRIPQSNANSNDIATRSNSSSGVENAESSRSEDTHSVAQQALVKVFERVVKGDDVRSEKVEEEKEEERKPKPKQKKEENGGENVNFQGLGHVICRLLVPSYQVGCVLGRGRKIKEKFRQESGVQFRVCPWDHIPACAWPGDELIQITGNFQSVKKALLSVSNCLQDSTRADAVLGANFPESYPQRGHSSGLQMDYQPRGYTSGPASETNVPKPLMVPEEEIVFKILCPNDKVGSLIGKGGCIVRGIENETGASVKITDAIAPDSDERVVIISARENIDMPRSPAQDAVIRVYSRISEIGFEPGTAAVGRLLVHSQQIGCLLGRGGNIVAEMRRQTGASIRIFGREQGSKFGIQNEEVVQIIGSLQSVHDALFQVTCRLREIIFPSRPSFYNVSGSAYLPSFPEIPSPLFRPRHDSPSPGHYPSPIGLPHGFDNFSAGPVQSHQPAFAHGMDRIGAAKSDNNHPYGNDRPTSPRTWNPQVAGSGNSSRISDIRSEVIARNGHHESACQQSVKTSIEIVVPQSLLCHVYGENNASLSQITQMSGADVVVHDPKPGSSGGLVVISGLPNQFTHCTKPCSSLYPLWADVLTSRLALFSMRQDVHLFSFASYL